MLPLQAAKVLISVRRATTAESIRAMICLSTRVSRRLLLAHLLLLLLFGSVAVARGGDNFEAVAVHTVDDNSSSNNIINHNSKNNNSNNYDMPAQQHYDNSADSTMRGSGAVLRRGKRYLEFTKGSRMSWRTNGKNNILNVNTLFAYGYGFRANYPFPDPKEQRKLNKVLFKRDLFHGLQTALDGHGFDGRACLLKSFCTAFLDVDGPQKSGMLFKLLKLIFSLEEHERHHMPYLREENCQQIMHSHCPLSFDSISPYTDDL